MPMQPISAIEVFAEGYSAGKLFHLPDTREHVFRYESDHPISLVMPPSPKDYVSKFHLHPIFDMNLPEGWLFEMLRNLLRKRLAREILDFDLFEALAPAVTGYLTYRTSQSELSSILLNLSLEDILSGRQENLFHRLVEAYLLRSAISGVQPKVLAPLCEKAFFPQKDFIVKTFGPEFPHLAENEFFCMQAVARAGIAVPRYFLSEDRRYFVVERFTEGRDAEPSLGFEEFCTLFGRTRNEKYEGSYERIAKAIVRISSRPEEDLKTFFRMIVMNMLLRNGDAHLKNFGVLYTSPLSGDIRLAPAYDVVCTLVYLPDDSPALTLGGRRIWFGKKELLTFGMASCLLSAKEADEQYRLCEAAVADTVGEIQRYCEENDGFSEFGRRMIDIFRTSLAETKRIKGRPT